LDEYFAYYMFLTLLLSHKCEQQLTIVQQYNTGP